VGIMRRPSVHIAFSGVCDGCFRQFIGRNVFIVEIQEFSISGETVNAVGSTIMRTLCEICKTKYVLTLDTARKEIYSGG
jgi:hypothetical protein